MVLLCLAISLEKKIRKPRFIITPLWNLIFSPPSQKLRKYSMLSKICPKLITIAFACSPTIYSNAARKCLIRATLSQNCIRLLRKSWTILTVSWKYPPKKGELKMKQQLSIQIVRWFSQQTRKLTSNSNPRQTNNTNSDVS